MTTPIPHLGLTWEFEASDDVYFPAGVDAGDEKFRWYLNITSDRFAMPGSVLTPAVSEFQHFDPLDNYRYEDVWVTVKPVDLADKRKGGVMIPKAAGWYKAVGWISITPDSGDEIGIDFQVTLSGGAAGSALVPRNYPSGTGFQWTDIVWLGGDNQGTTLIMERAGGVVGADDTWTVSASADYYPLFGA